MEPNHNNEFSTGSELPQLERAGDDKGLQPSQAATPETQGIQTGYPTGQGPSLPVTSAGLAATSVALPATDDPIQASSSSSRATSLMADDADLIEKEWVLRAKAIVMQTKNDPHQQNVEMTHIKADYLKKRYNKDLKVSET